METLSSLPNNDSALVNPIFHGAPRFSPRIKGIPPPPIQPASPRITANRDILSNVEEEDESFTFSARNFAFKLKHAIERILSWQTIVTGTIGFCFVLFNCTIQVMLDHKYFWGEIHWITPDIPPTPRIKSQEDFEKEVLAKKLPDIFFYLLTNNEEPSRSAKIMHGAKDSISWYSYLILLFDPDFILIFLLCATFLLVALPHPFRDVIMLRFLGLQATLFLIRGCSIAVTPLPPPQETCQIGTPSYDESFLY